MASENETTAERSGRRKRRWGDANTTTAAPVEVTTADPVKSKVLALQESIKARLAAAKAAAGTAGTIASGPPVKRAKHYDLDLGVTAPTYKEPQATTETKEEGSDKAAEKKAKKPKNSNPYLSHYDEAEEDEESPENHASVEDARLSSRTSKPRPRHKALKFTEAGHWQEIAERAREKAAMLEAIGFMSGRKTGHTVKSAGLASASAFDPTESQDLLPRADAHPDTKMPICVEWWDMEILPSKIKKQVAALESTAILRQTKSELNEVGTSSGAVKQEPDNPEQTTTEQLDEEQLREWCIQQSSLTYCKTASLIQHIVPVKPPNAYQGPPKEAVLKLTKKELKRQRKLRRQEKQRELQDLQAAGLIPAPEPRLTFRNFIQVLGDQAYLDPSQIERKVQEQIEARQRAHNERNEAKKLTKEQRSQKRAWKLQEDTSSGVTVAVFYVKDLSHPYHRAKVDLNAQQNNISGGVLECEVPKMACVICEGGPKAIKRYTRLMTVRMKWTGPDDDDDEEEEEEGADDEAGDEDKLLKSHKFNPDNECSLVWQGMAMKPAFKGFFFQACETSSQARKVLKTKGVEHYWDQVLQQASGRGESHVKLDCDSDDDQEENPFHQPDEDGDVVMS